MNWKNVYYLMQVERKSGRLLRGTNPRKFTENRVLANWPYLLSIVIGLVAGVFVKFIVDELYRATGVSVLQNDVVNLFVTLPMIILVMSIVLTLLPQMQRSGVKLQADTPYWLPITWSEHTLASILANLLGLPLCAVIVASLAILTFSVFNGLIILALMTSVAMFAAAFLSSAIMEVLRILQTRFTGAVYKSSGRAAIWVRFISSIAFFLIFFILYLSVIYGSIDLLSTINTLQNSIFYIPFVWPGLMLSNFFTSGGNILLGIIYMCLSIAFIGGMYALAVLLNMRFGLYEPPAITVQKSGEYTPKTGLLGKLGFSSNEAALIRKDFKAFTRRKELMTIFITPVLFVLIPLLQSFGGDSELLLFNAGMIYLFPASFMVMMLGALIIGEEGQSIWRIYASPISAKNLVKSKYFFTLIFGLIMVAITGVIGTVLYRFSSTVVVVGILEAFFLTIALGSISVNIGFIGADFTEVPKPRMVRQSWMLIGMLLCLVMGIIILLPIVPNVLSSMMMGLFGTNLPSLNPFVATAISGIIATAIAVIAYKLAIVRAKEFLRKAEV